MDLQVATDVAKAQSWTDAEDYHQVRAFMYLTLRSKLLPVFQSQSACLLHERHPHYAFVCLPHCHSP